MVRLPHTGPPGIHFVGETQSLPRGGTVSKGPEFLADLLKDLVSDSLPTANLMSTGHIERRLAEKLKAITPSDGTTASGASNDTPTQPPETKK
jgi:hypothetical protein